MHQHQPPARRWRQQLRRPGVAVGLFDGGVAEGGQCLFQQRRLLRMLLDGGQTILWPQQLRRDQGRAGIAAAALHQRQIGGQRFRQIARHVHQPGDAAFRLAGLARLFARQVVQASAGMAVHHREGGILAAQVQEYPHQRDMLDDVGEISGVIAVAIVHAAGP